jgi:hypothetical protein
MTAKKTSPSKKTVDGNDILYKLFKSLLEKDQDLAIDVIREMITKTAVWFPVETYQRIPVLLPWVVRDNSCKGTSAGNQWGSPNALGFVRDDNTMVKDILRPLRISGPNDSPLNGLTVSKGFVTSHVWREVNLEVLANKDSRLNTFIPNLVWLPKQISKLSDLEGGLVQTALKATAWNLYRNVPIESSLHQSIEDVWHELPKPELLSHFNFAPDELNFLKIEDSFYESRKKVFHNYITFIHQSVEGTEVVPKGIRTRYINGLPNIDTSVLAKTLAIVRAHTSSEMSPDLLIPVK